MSVTLDASVWLSSLSPTERAHRASRELLAALLENEIPLHQPGLFVVEVSATIARRTRNSQLALDASRALLGLPTLVMHELDHAAAAEATTVAATCALRGSDAVYVATAHRNGAVLITLDEEMRERGSEIVETMTPAELLRSFSQ